MVFLELDGHQTQVNGFVFDHEVSRGIIGVFLDEIVGLWAWRILRIDSLFVLVYC